MEQSKKPALLALARVLTESSTPFAIIGGVALQVRQTEPRTTLDIDVAVRDRASIPREALVEAGFEELGRHAHSDNWKGPGSTPVQFTDDPELREVAFAGAKPTLLTARSRSPSSLKSPAVTSLGR